MRGGKSSVQSRKTSKTQKRESSFEREKIEEVFKACLDAMGKGKKCERVSKTEGGLDECKPFGEKGWDSVTWTDGDKEDAQKLVGDKDKYKETKECLNRKARILATAQMKKRTRVEPDGQTPKTNSRSS